MTPAAERSTDPITLAVVVGALEAITREMAAVMLRTARSPVLKLSRDFSNALFDADATMVSQGDDLPCQLGTLMFTVKAVAGRFAGDVHDGDVFVHNDPQTGGNHLADLAIVKPVFVGGRLTFWAAVKAHMLDTGGSVAGAYNPQARDLFTEGVRIPAMRLVAGGELRQDVWDLLLANVRTAAEQDGDMRAMLSAVTVAGERLADLVDRYGRETVCRTLVEQLARSERRMRAEIASMPDGRFRGSAPVEPFADGAPEMEIVAEVVVDGDRCRVALSAPPQVEGYVNSYLANSVSAVLLGVLSFCAPDVPHNEGAYRALEIDAGAPGTLTNAVLPAPSGLATTTVGDNITDAVRVALSHAMPAAAVAGSSHTCGVNVSGNAPDSGDFYVYMAMAGLLGGGGASAAADGWHCVGTAAADGAMSAGDIELLEYEYPIHTRCYELRDDSAGPGRQRGGCGSIYSIEVVGHTADVSCWGEGVVHPAASLDRPEGRRLDADPRLGRRLVVQGARRAQLPAHGFGRLQPGDVLELHSPGGGGVGDPWQRPPQDVLADVVNGLVSVEAARDEYGVVLDVAGTEVDAAATAALRCER